jgi:uncharacterized protein YkwD
MRNALCLALALVMAALLPPSARAQGLSGVIDGTLSVTNSSTQSWMPGENFLWTVNTNREPAAFATWNLSVPQSGRTYQLQVFIPAPSLLESQPRTTNATYGIRRPGGGLVPFTLNQAVANSQWVSVPTGFLTFNQPGFYQVVLSGRTNEPAGTRVVVASAVRLVPGSGSGTPSGGSAQALEQRAVELINQMRALRGVAPLNRNAALDAAEEGHVQDMVRNDFISTEGSDGRGASERATRAGYSPSILTIWISVGESSAEELLRDVPEKILDPTYTDIGIAVAVLPEFTNGFIWDVVVATR